MSNHQLTRLTRALAGQQPAQPSSRRQVGRSTARDAHPTTGSEALMQEVASGSASAVVTSLNITRGDGTVGRAFLWGVPGFGWTQGEF